MKQTLSILLLLFSFIIKAQINLVPNPSFEEYHTCPGINNAGIIDSTQTVWFSPTQIAASHYHSCSSWPNRSIPNNSNGYQKPCSGDAYVSLILAQNIPPPYYGYRTYISTQVQLPLYKDSIYIVSFFISLAELPVNNPLRRRNLLSVSNIGVHISSQKPSFQTQVNIPLVPQIQNAPSRFLDDTTEWMKIEGIYKAHGGESFITIGNFCSEDSTLTKIIRKGTSDTTSGQAFYYLDDVSVTPYYYAQDTRTDTTICDDKLFTAYKRTGYDSCIWNDGSKDSIRTFATSGVYWATNFMQNIPITDTFYLSYKPAPVITSLHDTTVCFDEVAQILLDAGQFKSYLWKPTGETTRTIYSTAAQVYLLSVTDSNDCSAHKRVAVMETCPDFVFVPNAFTPNGDGLNDVFLPQTHNLESYSMNIVNRWGEIVFTTTNPQQGWDGKGAQNDVYVAIINYTITGKPTQQLKQNLTLLR